MFLNKLPSSFPLEVSPEYHGLGGLNSKHLFFTTWRLGSLRAGCQHSWVLAKGSLLGCGLLIVSSRSRKQEPAVWPLLCKGTKPVHGDFTLMT